MRVLITGVNGFVGPWLVRHLLGCQEVEGIWGMAWGPEGRAELAGIEVLDADLTNPDSLPPVLEAARPDVVLHLASASSIVASWRSPALALQVNAVGQINLFEALQDLQLKPLVVLTSSAQVYGKVPPGVTVHEDLPLAPLSPYAVSKAAQELIASQYHLCGLLPTIRLRLCNLGGPGRPDSFVDSSFARQIAEIEAGRRQPVIRVGNLDARRDFTDVRDAVRAMWLAARRATPGEVYNLCSGRVVAIRELLDQLLALSDHEVRIEVDPERLRPSDIPELRGDPSRLSTATGWRPEIELQQTLADLLDWWRNRLASEPAPSKH